MRLTITIECDNAAFCVVDDEGDPDANIGVRGDEVGRILHDAVRAGKFFLQPGEQHVLYDVNGNRVGQIKLEA